MHVSGELCLLFFKLAAPMHVLFFKVARSLFKQKYGTLWFQVHSTYLCSSVFAHYRTNFNFSWTDLMSWDWKYLLRGSLLCRGMCLVNYLCLSYYTFFQKAMHFRTTCLRFISKTIFVWHLLYFFNFIYRNLPLWRKSLTSLGNRCWKRTKR